MADRAPLDPNTIDHYRALRQARAKEYTAYRDAAAQDGDKLLTKMWEIGVRFIEDDMADYDKAFHNV